MLPNFIVIGAQRGGAGILTRVAASHPQAWMPKKSETHFFDMAHLWERGLPWYERNFFSRVPETARAVGEATPAYLMTPEAPARVAHVLGTECKLLVSLSNPVTRAYQQYLQNYAQLIDNQRFLDAVERKQALSSDSKVYSYLERGMYATQLERWLAHFPKENLFVSVSEEDWTPEHYEATCQRLYAFLGLETHSVPYISEATEVPSGKVIYFREGGEVQSGEHAMKVPKGALLLAPGHGQGTVVEKPSRALLQWAQDWTENQPRAVLGETERSNLLNEFFFDEVEKLEALLGRSLDCWRD